ncbi:hypothetical protein [Candidatus Coxiella mudrowiae]|uniref:hypothetical protein n=1 Tax=Candidatus Coxiella mudrowiae TaxID=2054173 RepID=UPI000C29226E|nr:hypothetical protein [Candidatus Coxiella mudrowiae]
MLCIHLPSKGGACKFTLLGLVKCVVKHRHATKARPRNVNPFTGEEMTFKAKPAHDVIKVCSFKTIERNG